VYPILFEYQGIFLPSWHVFFVMGVLSAYYSMQYCRIRFRVEAPTDSELRLFFVCVYVSSYFGARGLSIVIEDNPRSALEAFRLFFEPGAMTLLGGVLAGCITGISFIYLQTKESGIFLANTALHALMLGIAIGRVGCFLNGDDYGIVWNAWPAVIFPNHPDPQPRFPVQLLESFLALSIYVWGCVALKRNKLKNDMGGIGYYCLTFYAVARFFMEWLRGDNSRGIFLGLSTSQWISLGILLVMLTVFKKTWIRSCFKRSPRHLKGLF
jgi:phosphatidylglycerol---prolipoprotein diacylglyceryl transferase